jgi:hypothetical protein
VGLPPRVVRGSARQVAIASSENQTVRLPRSRRAASYSAQFVTLCRCFGIRRRRSWLALNGTAGAARGHGRAPLCHPPPDANRPIHATRSIQSVPPFGPPWRVRRKRSPSFAVRGCQAARSDLLLHTRQRSLRGLRPLLHQRVPILLAFAVLRSAHLARPGRGDRHLLLPAGRLAARGPRLRRQHLHPRRHRAAQPQSAGPPLCRLALRRRLADLLPGSGFFQPDGQ